MRLIDDYDGDDERSMADNNSTCFNFRRVPGKEKLSHHSLGIAVDINPFYNPYVRTDKEGRVLCSPEGSQPYGDREKDFIYIEMDYLQGLSAFFHHWRLRECYAEIFDRQA